MPTVRFSGSVLPRALNVSIDNIPRAQLKLNDSTVGLIAIFDISIQDLKVQVVCNTNTLDADVFQQLGISAFELARGAIDLISFSTGRSMTMVFETTTYDDGAIEPFIAEDATLPDLCTAFSPTDPRFSKAIDIVMSDSNIMLALNDLTSSLESPHRMAINSARAIERLRHVLLPGCSDPEHSWRNLRNVLNLNKSFLKSVTDLSIPERHGEWPEDTNGHFNSRRRAWQVMNRFLEYKIRNAGPLPKDDYPLLT